MVIFLFFLHIKTPPYKKKFTFHYGYILITTPLTLSTGTTSFTFHYGYILIDKGNTLLITNNEFTFHYGYILIFFPSILIQC